MDFLQGHISGDYFVVAGVWTDMGELLHLCGQHWLLRPTITGIDVNLTKFTWRTRRLASLRFHITKPGHPTRSCGGHSQSRISTHRSPLPYFHRLPPHCPEAHTLHTPRTFPDANSASPEAILSFTSPVAPRAHVSSPDIYAAFAAAT